MSLVAGIDSSTQSCKVLVCDADTGAVVRSGVAQHPAGTEVDPDAWWTALRRAVDTAGGFDDIAAVSVAGQQHGMVCLDDTGQVVRKALLWNDTRSADAATALVDELGGATVWAQRVGVVPVAAITVAKLRWLTDSEPANADATAAVCLPHDWLTWRLGGFSDIDELVTDRSDASGTGYFSAVDGYQRDLLGHAMRGRTPHVPRVLKPNELAGRVGDAVLGPGAGDNAAAALGLSAGAGDVIVSLGTSGVVSAISATAACDATGLVAGFADAAGAYLPLVCTLNGAPVLAATAGMLGVDFADFDRLALSAPAGADGLTLVPYFDGERSPNLPHAAGALHGMNTRNLLAANIARATVEGLLCAVAFCIDRIAAGGVPVERVLLTGGGARSEAVRRIAPAVLGAPVTVPEPAEYVALGAARQAAWAWTGAAAAPAWQLASEQTYTAAPDLQTRERYEIAQALTLGQGPGR